MAIRTRTRPAATAPSSGNCWNAEGQVWPERWQGTSVRLGGMGPIQGRTTEVFAVEVAWEPGLLAERGGEGWGRRMRATTRRVPPQRGQVRT